MQYVWSIYMQYGKEGKFLLKNLVNLFLNLFHQLDMQIHPQKGRKKSMRSIDRQFCQPWQTEWWWQNQQKAQVLKALMCSSQVKTVLMTKKFNDF